MNFINRNDQIICRIFGVKDASYISKPKLINNFVAIATELERACLELFSVDPLHARFSKLPQIQREAMQLRAVNCKCSLKYKLVTTFWKIKKRLRR